MTNNELITMRGAHSLTEILYTCIILYSRGKEMLCKTALLHLYKQRCSFDLEAGAEFPFRTQVEWGSAHGHHYGAEPWASSFQPQWPEPSFCISSLTTLISLCFSARGPEMRTKNEVCQLCSAGSWELLADWSLRCCLFSCWTPTPLPKVYGWCCSSAQLGWTCPTVGSQPQLIQQCLKAVHG